MELRRHHSFGTFGVVPISTTSGARPGAAISTRPSAVSPQIRTGVGATVTLAPSTAPPPAVLGAAAEPPPVPAEPSDAGAGGAGVGAAVGVSFAAGGADVEGS